MIIATRSDKTRELSISGQRKPRQAVPLTNTHAADPCGHSSSALSLMRSRLKNEPSIACSLCEATYPVGLLFLKVEWVWISGVIFGDRAATEEWLALWSLLREFGVLGPVTVEPGSVPADANHLLEAAADLLVAQLLQQECAQ